VESLYIAFGSPNTLWKMPSTWCWAALLRSERGRMAVPALQTLIIFSQAFFLDRINYVIHREDAFAPLLPRTSNITAEEGVDAAFAFVEAGPAAGAFVFAAGGGAGAGLAADGTVAACGEGVHREVAEEILQLLCDDLSKYTPLVASD
jgi:hypothetical protein